MPRLRPRVEDQPRLAHPLRLTRDQRHNPNPQGDPNVRRTGLPSEAMTTDTPPDPTSDAALNDAAIAVALSGRPYEIADLWELPGNPHDGDDVAVADSLARFGQVKPIAVSADGCVIAGNTTFRAARDLLGWSRIAGVEMTQAEAEQKAYALADNRTSQLGRDDPERMVAFFGEIEDWSGIGWDEDARAEIAALIAEPVVTPTPEVEPGDEAPLEPPSDESYDISILLYGA